MELIESRRYFRFGHCGNYHFPEAVEADGIRIVGHLADAPACPLCKTPLAHALLDNDDPIWLDFGEMRQIVDAPGKDRGTRHTVSVDNDQVRLGPYRLGDDDDTDDPRSLRPADPLWFLTNLIFGD